MNVTENEEEYRQFRKGSHEQIISAEQKRYAQVYTHERITENNDIITYFQTDNLMEQILHKDNLNKAPVKVLCLEFLFPGILKKHMPK